MRLRVLAVLLAATMGSVPISAALTEEAAREAAQRFGQALLRADASRLRPILPSRGKVQLRLVHLGPEEGFFSASQVEMLLGDFLKRGAADSFEVLRVEYDPERFALAHGRATVTDEQGRSASVGIHLAFQPEDDQRWVLREIRETPP